MRKSCDVLVPKSQLTQFNVEEPSGFDEHTHNYVLHQSNPSLNLSRLGWCGANPRSQIFLPHLTM